jgi:hypothetical protein
LQVVDITTGETLMKRFGPGPKPADSSETILKSLWQQFNSKFPTEEDCVAELSRQLFYPHGARCPNCLSQDIILRQFGRIFKCGYCKKTTWVTARTFFERIRSARPWLGAMWLMDHGLSFSALRFHKLAGIAYSSALNMLKKLRMVIQKQIESTSIAVPSAFFTQSMRKRSRETPARGHPVAEQEELERQSLDDASMSASSGVPVQEPVGVSELCGLEKELYEILPTEPADFDSLCELSGRDPGELSAALLLLELRGLARCMLGNLCVRAAPAEQQDAGESAGGGDSVEKWTKTLVAGVIVHLDVTFRGISRKYLQNYLAAYWCHVDRTRWYPGSLLEECCRSHAISYRMLLACVSPLLVMLPSCSLVNAG